ncbi:MAG TPA: type IV secretion system DNA-binding domain-containing protein [Candidatus Limnocylindrales bacterium]|nr:type IV secretion system DNA-binding domain-containing protein [Candidatus Limnocylindrales bacterium]
MTPNPTPAPAVPASPDPARLPPASQHLLDALTQAWAWCQQRPWLAAISAVGVVTVLSVRAYVVARRAKALHHRAQQLTIVPPPEVDPAGAGVFWATMTEILARGRRRWWRDGRAHIGVEYRWAGRALTIAVWVPGTIQIGPVQAAIRGAWPGASVTVDPATAPLSTGGVAAGGALAPVLPAWYPLQAEHDADPMRTLVAAASGLSPAESACVQILARPASRRQLTALRKGVAALRTGTRASSPTDPATWLRTVLNVALNVFGELLGPGRSTPRTTVPANNVALLRADPQRDRDARAAVDKLAAPQWAVAIRYGVAHTNPNTTLNSKAREGSRLEARLVTLAHGIASAFGAWTGRNRLRRLRLPRPQATLSARPLRRGFLLSVAELASIAAIPQDIAVPGLTRARAKPMPAPVEVPAGGRGVKVLGRAEVGGHSVALPVADARQHTHILGSTGSGKSTLMLNMILDDIHARRGVVVIDPKGDLVGDVLDRIPAALAGRLVLIDPDQNPGATLNPLAGDDHDLVVDNIVSIFSKIFTKHWGPRIDDVLRVSCLTLLRKANAILTLVPPLLNDRQFRHVFTEGLDDPEGLRGFWEWFESTPPPLRAQVIGPILARLRAFLLRDFVKRTLGVPQSSFDMGKVLNGGILLARLPKGQIGEETARLMGSFVLASAWQAATARTRIPESQRRDASIYIDEAQNFLNLPGSVGDMLAEARGYHLAMVLAHQNLTQMPRDTQLAISANARNKIYFSCAPEDAHQLARHTMPELDEHDLSHMDAFRAAARIVVDGRETPAFTLRTNPARPLVGEATAVRQAVAGALATNPAKRSGLATLAGIQPSTPDDGSPI